MPDSIVLHEVGYSADTGMPVLRKVNFSIEKGEVVLISGRTGHGKSTFLEICAGLLSPDSGTVHWDGTDIRRLSRREMFEARHNIGFVFQLHALISNHSIFDNVALPLRCRNGYNEKSIMSRVRSVLEELGLHNVDKVFPEALSAGQLKLAAVARALVGEPQMILLDEPTSGVDPDTARGIRNVLTEYRKKNNCAMVLITHETGEWNTLVHRRYVMDSGRLLECESNV